MRKQDVEKFLGYHELDLVMFALARANLTKNERTAIVLCGMQGMTQSEAGESVDRDWKTIQRWYSSGIKKLQACWSSSEWILKLIN